LSFTFSDIREVVTNNNKQRFALRLAIASGQNDSDPFSWEIKATQGHSITIVNELELNPITLTQGNAPQTVVHGTNIKAWSQIKQEGLKPMSRLHIHFATGLPGDDSVVSGIRHNSTVYIFVDIQQTLKDGMLWYFSENGVVLTSGINGKVNPKYFLRVIDRQGNTI
jgi:2'-phosphotransferase